MPTVCLQRLTPGITRRPEPLKDDRRRVGGRAHPVLRWNGSIERGAMVTCPSAHARLTRAPLYSDHTHEPKAFEARAALRDGRGGFRTRARAFARGRRTRAPEAGRKAVGELHD